MGEAGVEPPEDTEDAGRGEGGRRREGMRRGGGRRRPTYLTLGRRGEESVRLVLNLRRIRRMSILSQGAS